MLDSYSLRRLAALPPLLDACFVILEDLHLIAFACGTFLPLVVVFSSKPDHFPSGPLHDPNTELMMIMIFFGLDIANQGWQFWTVQRVK